MPTSESMEAERRFKGEATTVPDPGDGLMSVDCIADLPGVYSLFAFHYPAGSRYELTYSALCDGPDAQAVMGGIPEGCTYLGSEETRTLGAPDGVWERTSVLWEAAPLFNLKVAGAPATISV